LKISELGCSEDGYSLILLVMKNVSERAPSFLRALLYGNGLLGVVSVCSMLQFYDDTCCVAGETDLLYFLMQISS